MSGINLKQGDIVRLTRFAAVNATNKRSKAAARHQPLLVGKIVDVVRSGMESHYIVDLGEEYGTCRFHGRASIEGPLSIRALSNPTYRYRHPKQGVEFWDNKEMLKYKIIGGGEGWTKVYNADRGYTRSVKNTAFDKRFTQLPAEMGKSTEEIRKSIWVNNKRKYNIVQAIYDTVKEFVGVPDIDIDTIIKQLSAMHNQSWKDTYPDLPIESYSPSMVRGYYWTIHSYAGFDTILLRLVRFVEHSSIKQVHVCSWDIDKRGRAIVRNWGSDVDEIKRFEGGLMLMGYDDDDFDTRLGILDL